MYVVTSKLDVPDWVRCIGDVTVQIRGVGPVPGVHRMVPLGLGDARGDEMDHLSEAIDHLTDELDDLSSGLDNDLSQFSSELEQFKTTGNDTGREL